MVFIILAISSSVSAYYWGKRRGDTTGYQRGWLDGANDQSAMETHLRNEIKDLKETIGRFEVAMLKPESKKRAAKK